MQLKNSIILGFSILLMKNGHSQESTAIINLKQTLQIAEKNYPGIKAKQSELMSSQWRISSAKSGYLPELNIMDQYLYSTNNGITGSYYSEGGLAIPTSGGIRKDGILQPVFGSFTTLEVDWKFFNFGKVRNAVELSRQENLSIDAEYKNEIFRHLILVSDTYLLLLTAKNLTIVQENNVKRTEAFRNAVRAYTINGLRPGADSSFANAEYANALIRLSQSQQYEMSLKIKLAELTGTSRLNFNADPSEYLNSLPTKQSTDSSMISTHPALKIMESEVEESRLRMENKRLSYYPSFSLLAAGWARGSGVSNIDNTQSQAFLNGVNYQTYNYLIGFSFRWNMLNYPKVHFETESEKWQMHRYQFLYDEESLKLKQQLTDAQLQFMSAFEQAQLTPVQLEAARATYSQTQARYNSGIANLPELTQSYYLLNRAETDMAISYSNVWRALLLQAAAAGDLNIFINNK